MRVSLITTPEDTLTFAWMGRRASGDLAILAVYLMHRGEFVAVTTREGASREYSSRGCFQQLLDDELAGLRGDGYRMRRVDLDAPGQRAMVLGARRVPCPLPPAAEAAA